MSDLLCSILSSPQAFEVPWYEAKYWKHRSFPLAHDFIMSAKGRPRKVPGKGMSSQLMEAGCASMTHDSVMVAQSVSMW